MPRNRNIDLFFAFKQPPRRAVNYFRSKGFIITHDWHETLAEAHSAGFTVAHAARLEVLQNIRAEVDKAISEGITFRQFSRELKPRLMKIGWWGKIFEAGGKDGTREILLGSPHRLKTIYRTNLASAHNAGREDSFQASKRLVPYGQYIAIVDPITRDLHERLNGLVFHLDDPFWDSFTPPIDYNCRCRKRALTQKQIERRGLKILTSEGRLEKGDFVINRDNDKLRTTFFTDSDGTRIPVHPSFNFNQWKAAYQPDLDKYDTDIARKYIEGTVTGPDFERFFNLLTPGGYRNVGIIDEDDVKKIARINTKTITINKAGMRHVRNQHKKLTLEEFQQLQNYVREADLITLINDKKLTFYRYISDDLAYLTVLDITGGRRNQLRLSTFYRLEGSDDSRRKKPGKIREEVEKLQGIIIRDRLR